MLDLICSGSMMQIQDPGSLQTDFLEGVWRCPGGGCIPGISLVSCFWSPFRWRLLPVTAWRIPLPGSALWPRLPWLGQPQGTAEQEETKTEEKVEGNTEQKPESEKVERSSLENLRVLENIDVKLTVEVGGAEIKLRELLRINEGSVIELERLAGDPLDILANGTIIAKGEVVMIGERFGIRFTEVVDPKERVQNL